MVNKKLKFERSLIGEVDPMFVERWSPRSFLNDPLSDQEIEAIFEAARWAPSSSNSQPWEFVYATNGPERDEFDALLREGNRQWVPHAPLLILVLSKKFSENGKVLRTNMFDAGAASMSIAFQANKLGLYAHAIGGILIDEIHEILRIPRDEYDIICAMAIGRHGPVQELSDGHKEQEFPNDRKPCSEFVWKWPAKGKAW